MIAPAYCQLLARYGRWMNERMYAALATVDDQERKRDRGAFFGSIHGTLNHLVWADATWLSRFGGAPYAEAAYGADLFEDFASLSAARESTDRAVLHWAGQVTPSWLDSALEYRSAADGRRRQLPAWVAAAHMFNHATQHRGQVHPLLTQVPYDPPPLDLM